MFLNLPRWTLLLGIGFALVPSAARALPLISEVFYDAVGSDDGRGFVELYGAPGTLLDGMRIEGVNGSGGAIGPALTLSGAIPADGFFVVADDLAGGPTLVANADLVLSFDFQNGPDSIVLRSGDVVLDAVGYGVFAAGDVFAGEGSPAPAAPAGASLARTFADFDSGDNAADFAVLATPTPGTGDLAPVPEPGTWMLLGLGLGGVGLCGRRVRLRA
jgi:hypothetical protein